MDLNVESYFNLLLDHLSFLLNYYFTENDEFLNFMNKMFQQQFIFYFWDYLELKYCLRGVNHDYKQHSNHYLQSLQQNLCY